MDARKFTKTIILHPEWCFLFSLKKGIFFQKKGKRQKQLLFSLQKINLRNHSD